jgi:hypothetical protein
MTSTDNDNDYYYSLSELIIYCPTVLTILSKSPNNFSAIYKMTYEKDYIYGWINSDNKIDKVKINKNRRKKFSSSAKIFVSRDWVDEKNIIIDFINCNEYIIA